MASVALGLIGGFLFGPEGYLVGSLIGSLLDPPKQEGPRLQSLKLQVSQYGEMVKDVWGTMRIAGNVIWIGNGGNLVEHKHESGGKGGPQVTTYTYTASFAVGLCNRVGTRTSAILGITRIWADSRLIWGRGVSGDSAIPMTVYLGDETQTADPTMEADLGAGNVPGFRGTAYVVFTDWDLSQFFNRIPNLEFEVYTAAGTIPIRISTFSSNPDDTQIGPNASYDPATGYITVSEWSPGNRGGYAERQWLIDGTPISQVAETPMPGDVHIAAIIENSNLACVADIGGGLYWYYRGGLVTTLPDGSMGTFVLPLGGGAPFDVGFFYIDPATGNQYIYVRNGISSDVVRYPCTGSLPFANFDLLLDTGFGSNIKFGASDNGKVYIHEGPNINEYTPDLTLTHQWTAVDFPAGFNTAALYDALIVRRNNFFAFSYAGLDFDTLNLVSIAADNTLSLYPQPRGGSNLPTYDFLRGNISPLFDGYVLGRDGVTLLDPPLSPVTLAEIVTDVSGECGLTSGQIDVTELTDLVDGFVIGSQMTGRNRLDSTRNAYFYGSVESDAKVKFPKLARASIVTIPDDELAAFVTGTTPPPQLNNERAQEFDLPQQLTVEYINKDADYQTGSQIAQRQVTQSQSKVSLQLPISMSDAKGLQIANVLLDSAWAEREKYTIVLPRKYAYLDPGDVITTMGRDFRLVTREETGTTTIKFEAVQEFTAVYTQAAIGIAATGMPPQTPPAANATTDLLLLDLPLTSDSDTPGSGFYSAMGPDGGGPWPGATLMRSIDSGVSYSSLLVDKQADTLGTTSDALGAWDPNNNILDTVNSVTVMLTAGGTLSGVTLDAMLNGANMAAIGAEIIQFQNAALVSTGTYTLSGLLRGRRGTEWAIANHAIGDAFVLLPVDRADTPLSDLFLERSYKGVTAGQTVASAAAQLFTNTGNGLRPYSPVQLGGGVDASGNVTMNWTRRTRIGGAWMPFVDVPLSEPSEQYVVQIWNSTYALVAASAIVSSQTTALSAADQVALFGAVQQTIFFTVSQLGIANIGTEARGSIAGTGSSNDPPLNPIPPYGS